MTPTIRAAVKADVIPIQAIYAHHVLHGTGTFETEPPDVAEMSRRHATITEAGLPYYVAEYDGMILGYGYAGPFRPRAAYRYTLEDSIYLHPDWTGQGLGRLLLDHLIKESATRGYKQLVAVIGDSDNRASVRLHHTAGFIETGVLKSVGHKFDRWLDVVIMQRTL
jgi:phosphinothricin acetyltransferase